MFAFIRKTQSNMNIKPSYFALLLLLLLSLNTQAQRRSNYNASSDDYKHFTVGIAPISLLTRFGKFNVRGEWAYANNKSLSLLASIPITTNVPSVVAKNVDVSEGTIINNEFKNLNFVLENRFYIAQDKPRGFYLAPYARYTRYDLSRNLEKTSNNSTTTIRGTLGGVGIGGAAGVQFSMGPYMTMDITFAAVDIKWMRGTLRYKTNDPENDISMFRDQVQKVVSDIPVIGNNLAAVIDGDEVKARVGGIIVPGYRFNMSVNFAF